MLLIDVGNTRIKWLFRAAKNSNSGAALQLPELIAQLQEENLAPSLIAERSAGQCLSGSAFRLSK